MTRLDDKFLPLAKRLIDTFGKVVTLTTEPQGGNYNPKLGTTDKIVGSAFSVKIIPPDKYQRTYIEGDLIENGDLVTGMAAQGAPVTPTKGMQIDLDGSPWRIERVRPIYSGELIAMWELQLRQ